MDKLRRANAPMHRRHFSPKEALQVAAAPGAEHCRCGGASGGACSPRQQLSIEKLAAKATIEQDYQLFCRQPAVEPSYRGDELHRLDSFGLQSLAKVKQHSLNTSRQQDHLEPRASPQESFGEPKKTTMMTKSNMSSISNVQQKKLFSSVYGIRTKSPRFEPRRREIARSSSPLQGKPPVRKPPLAKNRSPSSAAHLSRSPSYEGCITDRQDFQHAPSRGVQVNVILRKNTMAGKLSQPSLFPKDRIPSRSSPLNTQKSKSSQHRKFAQASNFQKFYAPEDTRMKEISHYEMSSKSRKLTKGRPLPQRIGMSNSLESIGGMEKENTITRLAEQLQNLNDNLQVKLNQKFQENFQAELRSIRSMSPHSQTQNKSRSGEPSLTPRSDGEQHRDSFGNAKVVEDQAAAIMTHKSEDIFEMDLTEDELVKQSRLADKKIDLLNKQILLLEKRKRLHELQEEASEISRVPSPNTKMANQAKPKEPEIDTEVQEILMKSSIRPPTDSEPSQDIRDGDLPPADILIAPPVGTTEHKPSQNPEPLPVLPVGSLNRETLGQLPSHPEEQKDPMPDFVLFSKQPSLFPDDNSENHSLMVLAQQFEKEDLDKKLNDLVSLKSAQSKNLQSGLKGNPYQAQAAPLPSQAIILSSEVGQRPASSSSKQEESSSTLGRYPGHTPYEPKCQIQKRDVAVPMGSNVNQRQAVERFYQQIINNASKQDTIGSSQQTSSFKKKKLSDILHGQPEPIGPYEERASDSIANYLQKGTQGSMTRPTVQSSKQGTEPKIFSDKIIKQTPVQVSSAGGSGKFAKSSSSLKSLKSLQSSSRVVITPYTNAMPSAANNVTLMSMESSQLRATIGANKSLLSQPISAKDLFQDNHDLEAPMSPTEEYKQIPFTEGQARKQGKAGEQSGSNHFDNSPENRENTYKYESMASFKLPRDDLPREQFPLDQQQATNEKQEPMQAVQVNRPQEPPPQISPFGIPQPDLGQSRSGGSSLFGDRSSINKQRLSNIVRKSTKSKQQLFSEMRKSVSPASSLAQAQPMKQADSREKLEPNATPIPKSKLPTSFVKVESQSQTSKIPRLAARLGNLQAQVKANQNQKPTGVLQFNKGPKQPLHVQTAKPTHTRMADPTQGISIDLSSSVMSQASKQSRLSKVSRGLNPYSNIASELSSNHAKSLSSMSDRAIGRLQKATDRLTAKMSSQASSLMKNSEVPAMQPVIISENIVSTPVSRGGAIDFRGKTKGRKNLFRKEETPKFKRHDQTDFYRAKLELAAKR